MKKFEINPMFSDNLKSAILVYIVEKYNEVGKKQLGRTIIQKISYFLKFINIPLPYSFKLYYYGPFSQELLNDIDLILADGLIMDKSPDPNSSEYRVTKEGKKFLQKYDTELKKSKENIDKIVNLVQNLDSSGMELFSTTHYTFWAYKNYDGKNPSREFVVDRVFQIKERKFKKSQIGGAFDQMKRVGMLGAP